MDDGKITKPLLKSRSGEFDVDSIHSLNLKDYGISDLGCIGECTGLERLNLSCNDVSRLTKLAGLNNLTFLNLSANRISSLEGLQALESLQILNLSGNLIGSVDSLRCLTGLEKLEELRLQDKIHGLSNPVCMNRNYRKDMIDIFPNLKILDGERLLGHGSDVFSMCRKIEDALEKRKDFSISEMMEPEPWVPDSFWRESGQFEVSILADAEQQLEDMLASCKMSVNKSEKILDKLKTENNSPNNKEDPGDTTSGDFFF